MISLSGLGGAASCKHSVVLPLLGTTIFNNRDVELPSCLLSMNNLTTLHVAGNGFIGQVDPLLSNVDIVDLSLSHNRFGGPVPNSLRNVKKLDLSVNRFTGHFSGANGTTPQAYIDARVNRLSGRLSTNALENVLDLKLISGNMFSCDTIPANDADSGSYSCGNCE